MTYMENDDRKQGSTYENQSLFVFISFLPYAFYINSFNCFSTSSKYVKASS